MIRYWVKNKLLISAILLIILVSIICVVFLNANIRNLSNAYNEVSIFEGSSINFDVPSPSKDQITDLLAISHIDTVIPYYYTTKTVRYSSDGLSSVGVLLFDNFDNIELTMYNSSRIIQKSNVYSNNPILVDYEFILSTGLKLGDIVQIDFGGSLVSFTINAIYETNSYYNSNSILGLWQGDQKSNTESSLGKELNYSGAYIVSNDISLTENYLDSEYKPYGRLKDPSEFETYDAYLIHYNAFMDGNYSNEITNFDNLKEIAQEKANDFLKVAQINLISGVILLLFAQLSFNLVLVFRKSEIKYFRSKVRIGSSFKPYYITSMVFEFVFSSVLLVGYAFLLRNQSTIYLPMDSLYETIAILMIVAFVASIISCFGSIFIINKATR